MSAFLNLDKSEICQDSTRQQRSNLSSTNYISVLRVIIDKWSALVEFLNETGLDTGYDKVIFSFVYGRVLVPAKKLRNADW